VRERERERETHLCFTLCPQTVLCLLLGTTSELRLARTVDLLHEPPPRLRLDVPLVLPLLPHRLLELHTHIHRAQSNVDGTRHRRRTPSHTDASPTATTTATHLLLHLV
jgi:hypothetical protein